MSELFIVVGLKANVGKEDELRREWSRQRRAELFDEDVEENDQSNRICSRSSPT